MRISDRHFGVGGDGIVLICPSDKADAKMRMFNIDGSEGKMCGNAIRCVGKYLYDNGIKRCNPLTIDTLSGIKTLNLNIGADGKVDSVRVDMGKAILKPEEIPVKLDGETAVARPVTIDGKEYKITCVSMGNPHCVVFTDTDMSELPLEKIGPKFEFDSLFPERVNTEFINVIDKNTLKMRVWERGSGETLACGTGMTASALLHAVLTDAPSPIQVDVAGGDTLKVGFQRTGDRFTSVTLTGPADLVFTGDIEL